MPSTLTMWKQQPSIGIDTLKSATRASFIRNYGKIPEEHGKGKEQAQDYHYDDTPMPAPSIPSDREELMPPRAARLQHNRSDAVSIERPLPELPESSASESYAMVAPNAEEDSNPLYTPDPRLFEVRKITEVLSPQKPRGAELTEALLLTFDEARRNLIFHDTVVELAREEGANCFILHPDYAAHLIEVMRLVSDTLNQYLKAAGKPRTFSFMLRTRDTECTETHGRGD